MSANPPEFAVETRALAKTYRAGGRRPPQKALDGIDLAIPRGSFFGLLGPNGAGKSTFINILAGLVVKTSGEGRVWGFDIEMDMRAARRAIGVVPQELNIDPFFTPRELLEVQAGLYGVPARLRRTESILESVGLMPQADAYARTLSGGMRRRLLVAKAMVHQPPVLVLDEPTAGVDVELRHQLWTMVKDLNARGTTVLLTTHYLEEAEELCDRIAIIDRGRLIACEAKQDLLKRLDAKEMTVTLDRDLAAVPANLAGFSAVLEEPRRLRIQYPPSRVRAGDILAALQEAGLGIVDLSTRETALEDIFLRLTGKAGEEG
ncbi:MAG: ABC transporter ATP-binding protein [Magnetospirillum sp. WYHS-4]